eukprot:2105890-Prymnesium_polylepis.1
MAHPPYTSPPWPIHHGHDPHRIRHHGSLHPLLPHLPFRSGAPQAAINGPPTVAAMQGRRGGAAEARWQ